MLYSHQLKTLCLFMQIPHSYNHKICNTHKSKISPGRQPCSASPAFCIAKADQPQIRVSVGVRNCQQLPMCRNKKVLYSTSLMTAFHMVIMIPQEAWSIKILAALWKIALLSAEVLIRAYVFNLHQLGKKLPSSSLLYPILCPSMSLAELANHPLSLIGKMAG